MTTTPTRTATETASSRRTDAAKHDMLCHIVSLATTDLALLHFTDAAYLLEKSPYNRHEVKRHLRLATEWQKAHDRRIARHMQTAASPHALSLIAEAMDIMSDHLAPLVQTLRIAIYDHYKAAIDGGDPWLFAEIETTRIIAEMATAVHDLRREEMHHMRPDPAYRPKPFANHLDRIADHLYAGRGKSGRTLNTNPTIARAVHNLATQMQSAEMIEAIIRGIEAKNENLATSEQKQPR